MNQPTARVSQGLVPRGIRRTAGMILVLGAVLGCANEEETTPTPSPISAPPPMAGPGPPPTTPGEPQKGGMSAEMTPPAAKADPAKKSDELKPNEPPKVEGPTTDAAKPQGAAVKLSAEALAAIKELPGAEQALAIQQAVCPVSDEHLGEMGKPVKVTAEGRTFFLCCEGCEKDVKTNPKAVIAKLDKK